MFLNSGLLGSTFSPFLLVVERSFRAWFRSRRSSLCPAVRVQGIITPEDRRTIPPPRLCLSVVVMTWRCVTLSSILLGLLPNCIREASSRSLPFCCWNVWSTQQMDWINRFYLFSLLHWSLFSAPIACLKTKPPTLALAFMATGWNSRVYYFYIVCISIDDYSFLLNRSTSALCSDHVSQDKVIRLSACIRINWWDSRVYYFYLVCIPIDDHSFLLNLVNMHMRMCNGMAGAVV